MALDVFSIRCAFKQGRAVLESDSIPQALAHALAKGHGPQTNKKGLQ